MRMQTKQKIGIARFRFKPFMERRVGRSCRMRLMLAQMIPINGKPSTVKTRTKIGSKNELGVEKITPSVKRTTESAGMARDSRPKVGRGCCMSVGGLFLFFEQEPGEGEANDRDQEQPY